MSIKDKYVKDKKVTHQTATEEGAAAAVLKTSLNESKVEPKKTGKKATFILDEDLHYELKTAAAKLRRNMSDIVEDSLKKTFEELKKNGSL